MFDVLGFTCESGLCMCEKCYGPKLKKKQNNIEKPKPKKKINQKALAKLRAKQPLYAIFGKKYLEYLRNKQ
tara:strand:- start:615 stop:827 length:213 start_codon:yes stop_codon:yes gene_type:complete